jgi:ABC-type uncharacterized transport system involved in gliding motility auxiliary subunit
MKTLRSLMAWLLAPKSDFILFAVVLVLANLVGANAFLRFDLTAGHSYSLSRSSREVLQSLEEPLAVKVFFSSNLPSPYNNVERYLKDLLVEYKGTGSRKFSYEFFDMNKSGNRELAQSYGIQMVQIQEVNDTEVGLKSAYMGLAIVYSDSIKVLDNLASTDGLEYQLTTTIGKMITTTNALSGLAGKVQMTLYASRDLEQFGISGYSDLDQRVSAVYSLVNKKSLGKLDYQRVDPVPADVDALASKYGLQKISWAGQKGQSGGSGVLGIVLEYRNRFRTIPLELVRGLLGGYGIAGFDTLEQNLSDSLEALLLKSPEIGYVTGHGEKDLQDSQKGAAVFSSLVSDMYQFKPVDTSKEEIPANISSLVINGPRTAFSESELYKIDQFLMRGGNLFVMLDPFEEVANQSQSGYYGAPPSFRPVNTGLEKLLKKYGVTPVQDYVLDKNCYVARAQGSGEMPVYYAPLLSRQSLNQNNPVSRDLAYVLFLQAGSLDINSGAASKTRKIIPLADSSDEAWLMKDNINLSPYGMQVPGRESMATRHLAVLLEGKFDSAFDKNPDEKAGTGAAALDTSQYLAKSVQDGKIIVTGTSALTDPSVMDKTGRQPVAVFVRNAIDYLNGNGDLIEMRTKGLGLDTLNKTSPAVRSATRIVNVYGLPVLVGLAGLYAWRRRVLRRRKIRARYAAGDTRETEGKA